MTLREKIDGLHTAKTGWVKLADVLRIVAEHEQETKGGGEPARTELPGHHVTAPPVGQAGGQQSEPAETPRWRKELERLHATIGQEPDPLSMADHRRLAALLDLAILADVIASGRGQAVVPDGVLRELWPESPPKPMIATWRSGDLLFAEGMRQDDIQGMNDRVHDILAACDTVGDSLCGAP